MKSVFHFATFYNLVPVTPYDSGWHPLDLDDLSTCQPFFTLEKKKKKLEASSRSEICMNGCTCGSTLNLDLINRLACGPARLAIGPRDSGGTQYGTNETGADSRRGTSLRHERMF